jgi:molybdopterin converting factor small subunit
MRNYESTNDTYVISKESAIRKCMSQDFNTSYICRGFFSNFGNIRYSSLTWIFSLGASCMKQRTLDTGIVFAKEYTILQIIMSLPSLPYITVRVLFFAAARDAVNGQSQIDIIFNSDVLSSFPNSSSNSNNCTVTTITANTVREYMLHHYPKLHPYIHHDITSITMALNEVYIPHGTDPTIHNNDVIAIIPPISGG